MNSTLLSILYSLYFILTLRSVRCVYWNSCPSIFTTSSSVVSSWSRNHPPWRALPHTVFTQQRSYNPPPAQEKRKRTNLTIWTNPQPRYFASPQGGRAVKEKVLYSLHPALP
uniref:Secreted protein n=1 Tax=Cacopsylla melanoneura TaxID=428564 RepID=A0A8D9DML8_9HEMI